eukprot:s616_g5.t1
MQEDWGRTQNAKALAILEVKDAVIERLEQELSKAEVEVGHHEELAEQAGVRAALATQTQIEATKGELATLQSANLHEVHDFTESDCEALAEMAEQAERRAWRAEEEVVSLRAESDDAKQKVNFLTNELAASMATAATAHVQAPQKVAEFQEAVLQKSQLPPAHSARPARPSEAMTGNSTNGRKPLKAVAQAAGSRERSSDKANPRSAAKPAPPARPEMRDLGDASWLKDELLQEERGLLLLASGKPGSQAPHEGLREALRFEQLRAERCSLEHDLEQKRFATKVAMTQLHEAEQQSQAAAAFLPQVSVALEPSIRKMQRACKKEMHALQTSEMDEQGQAVESLECQQEADNLRQALREVGESMQRQARQAEHEDPKQGFWKQGVAELVGQVMLLLGSVNDLNLQLRCSEMAIEEALHRQPVPEILEELQSVDLRAQEVLNEAKSSAAMCELRQTASQRTSVLHDIADTQGQLRQLKLQNEILSDRKQQVSKALSSLRTRQQKLLAEELKTDEVGESSVVLQTLLNETGKESPATQQVLAAILGAIARAQWLAVKSEMTEHTWKSLAHTLVPSLPMAMPLPAEQGGSALSEPSKASLSQDQLEAQVSALTLEFHQGMAECEKCELESQTFEATFAEQLEVAEKKAKTETAQQLDLWRKKLFETCTTLLRDSESWQTTACAEVRERGLESEVEELASMNQRAEDRIAILSSHYENLQTSYVAGRVIPAHNGDPFYSRQHVLELKSQLRHVRKELNATRDRCEGLQADRRPAAPADPAGQTEAPRRTAALDLEQVCAAVTSMAERVEHMCMEADRSTRQSEGNLVLQELASSKEWCEEVQAGLMQQREFSEELHLSGNAPSTIIESEGSFLASQFDAETLALRGGNVPAGSQRSGAVLQRVEAIFQAQHDLHRGYRAVLKEIHDLQLKKQLQEQELQDLREASSLQRRQQEESEANMLQLHQEEVAKQDRTTFSILFLLTEERTLDVLCQVGG